MAEVDLYFPQFAYGTTKAALEQITTSMAADLALRKVPIRINAIQPGVFPRGMTPAEIIEEYRTKPFPGFIAPVPLSRWGK
jgi:NAD(P)-dependent dehydrogenase (short-subunit alcohol dehydrogenase family)